MPLLSLGTPEVDAAPLLCGLAFSSVSAALVVLSFVCAGTNCLTCSVPASALAFLQEFASLFRYTTLVVLVPKQSSSSFCGNQNTSLLIL